MKAVFTVSAFPNGGGQLKVSGSLDIRSCRLFHEELLKLASGTGNYFLSLRDLKDADLTALQLLRALRMELIKQDRRLTISWPQDETLLQLLNKTGVLHACQQ